MSKSHSPTPTPRVVSTNSPSLQASTSRPHDHPSPIPLSPSVQRTAATPAQVYPLSDPGVTSSTSSRRRPAVSSDEQPPAKRRRRKSPGKMVAGSVARSSPSTDSQDGLADTEVESGQGQPQPPPEAPPKKKRTRTLTTPHQAAVLHALLAQSRFPTTAMREEVGRSIGLSARKVQIWFQNQRQKARRPRSQSDAPLARPPQYGPYTNTSAPSSSFFTPPGLSTSMEPYGQSTHISQNPASEHGYRGQLLSEPQRETRTHLLGPGMPGPELPLRRYETLGVSDIRTAAGASRYQPLPSLYAGPFPPPGGHSSPVRPHSAHTSRELQPSFSRVLPPLIPDPTPRRASYSTSSPINVLPPMTQPGPSISPSTELRRSLSPLFARRSPEHVPRSAAGIPPPFTLQPNPRWDNAALAAFPRPSTSAWSHHSSQSTESHPTDTPRSSRVQSPEQERTPRPESSRPRTSRYDPIRDNEP